MIEIMIEIIIRVETGIGIAVMIAIITVGGIATGITTAGSVNIAGGAETGTMTVMTATIVAAQFTTAIPAAIRARTATPVVGMAIPVVVMETQVGCTETLAAGILAITPVMRTAAIGLAKTFQRTSRSIPILAARSGTVITAITARMVTRTTTAPNTRAAMNQATNQIIGEAEAEGGDSRGSAWQLALSTSKGRQKLAAFLLLFFCKDRIFRKDGVQTSEFTCRRKSFTVCTPSAHCQMRQFTPAQDSHPRQPCCPSALR